MIKRIVEISNPSWLHIEHRQLCVEQDKAEVARIPVEDLGVLVLAHQAISLTQSVVIACQENNAVIVFCDQRHLPYSIVLPVSEGHSLHHKTLQMQLGVSKATHKRLWQQIVRTKIRYQAQTLALAGIESALFTRLISKVKSGDPENIEAQAAQRYWRLLFGDSFRRDRQTEGINTLLNYGYAIVRALIARAVVASGLHPALGVHHANQYNGLCLADDLMEPFRPWVDNIALRLSKDSEDDLALSPETKKPFLALLSEAVIWGDGTLPFLTASHHYVAGFKHCLTDAKRKMDFPEWPENRALGVIPGIALAG